MTDYLKRWALNVVSQKSLSLTRSIRVEGLRRAHLGPKSDFAWVELVVDPANDLEVVVELPPREASRDWDLFVESAIFGFLDVALLAATYPYKDMKLRVVGIQIHPIDSNQNAFRLAGRDAGRKFIDAVMSKTSKH